MVQKYICQNGMRIVHEKMLSVRAISVGIWVQAGSNDELSDEAGLAHFIEHMLFKGTKKHSAKTIAEQFDRMGGELNAFTSKEATCYHTTILKEDAEEALALLADMFMNSTFDEAEMNKEKQVILEEIAMYEDTPDDEVHEQLWRTMYPTHPVGKPVLGNSTSVLGFTKASIQQFMKRLYRPERIVISIAGNYDEALIPFIAELFSAIVKTGQAENRPVVNPIFQAKQVTMTKEVEQAHLCIGFPSLTLTDDRKYALSIVDSLIGGSMSSRLFQEVREKNGLAYSIYSYYTLYEMTGAFIIYGGTAPEKLAQLQETIQSVLLTVVENGISDEEMNHAIQSIKSSFLLGLESVESRMSRNGHQELLLQAHLTMEEVIEKIEHVQKEEVESLMKQLFSKPFASAVIRPDVAN